MNIIQMSIKVLLIPYDVIPKTVLPYSPWSVLLAEFSRIGNLEAMHQGRNVFISNLDYNVKMIRQDYPDARFNPLPTIREEPRVLEE